MNQDLKIKNTSESGRGYRNFAHYKLRLLLNGHRIREDHALTRSRTALPGSRIEPRFDSANSNCLSA